VSKKERNGKKEMVEMCSRQVAKSKMKVRECDESIKEELGIYIIFFFVSNATTCACGLRGPPSWAWQ